MEVAETEQTLTFAGYEDIQAGIVKWPMSVIRLNGASKERLADLAVGHLKALEYAKDHTGAEAINLGTGNGISVLEPVHAFEKANHMQLPHSIGPRRDGDLPAFWADAQKAKILLGWETKYTVEDMCQSSWNFARKSADQ